MRLRNHELGSESGSRTGLNTTFAITACLLEASARKPGNVHPEAFFPDLQFADFVLSAGAIGPVIGAATPETIGSTILDAVAASRRVAASNAHLGTILALVPLAAASPKASVMEVARLVDVLTVNDTGLIYEAIRRSDPGGMGTVADQDVRDRPTVTPSAAMKLAADRDMIARQYINGFADVIEWGVPLLRHLLDQSSFVEDALIRFQWEWLARHPDSLIVRKHGPEAAAEVSRQAEKLLHRIPETESGLADHEVVRIFDSWLRSTPRKNPGTTADLIAAALFRLLREDGPGLVARKPFRPVLFRPIPRTDAGAGLL